MDLFEKQKKSAKTQPLAVRMRPKTLSEFVGQEHIIREGKLLKRAIEADRICSVIFYGPPGSGKTALGYLICDITKSYFQRLNATASNVQEIRTALDKSKSRFALDGKRTILFIDEIHRFNKAQQDVLMPDVETGNPILIGTTTHNPFFSVNTPLLSRSQILEFKPLTEDNIITILNMAVQDKERGFGKLKLNLEKPG